MSQIEGVLTTTLDVTVALDTSCFIVVNLLFNFPPLSAQQSMISLC